MDRYILKLYVAGKSPRSKQALENITRVLEEERLESRYEIEVIDVLENPERAENQKILATPTLIKELPLPIRRIIGDLSDAQRVLLGLDIVAQAKKS